MSNLGQIAEPSSHSSSFVHNSWRGCYGKCYGGCYDKSALSGPKHLIYNEFKELVGETGFEPATLCSQSRCATRLRYSPTRDI
jgi:hypothetical protein